jgi:hypothetical protein
MIPWWWCLIAVAAFLLGTLLAYHWAYNAAIDTLKAAESAASIAQGYCEQGQSFYARAHSLEREVAKMNAACDLLTKANNAAAESLDKMDRTQGAMLSALINVGIIGRTGGTAAGPGARESDFAG